MNWPKKAHAENEMQGWLWRAHREFFIGGNSSVCKNYVGLNEILFRNHASLQYSLCGVTIACEYDGKP
jgi:hypothetical protein